MLRTLHTKLAAVLLGLLCFTALLCIPLTLFTAQRYLQEADQKHNRTLAEHLAEHLAEKNFLRRDARTRAQATAEIKRLMVINPNVEVYLLDRDGDILAYSAAPGRVHQTRVAVEPLRRMIHAAGPLPILGDDPREPRARKIFSAAPIPVRQRRGSEQIRGFVYIILAGEEYRSAGGLLQRSYMLRLSLLMLLGILVFVLITGFYLFHFLTRRLRRLTAAVDAFQRNDFREPVAFALASAHETPRDEIDRLGQVYRQMSERIGEQIHGLREADAHRREMVSNVSHDLRTPLAALQGYLETLLMKEGKLTPAEQKEYLEIAVRHSERLGKLVGELFELARLDAREVQVHAEPFSIAELVQDVALKFQLAARQKNLRLETDLDGEQPFVCADIGLIERVLENLIENALRYTPEGGVVTLALRPDDAQVTVQVRDTGRGIRDEDLPHIFERYYRVENQPETPGCAGLGLAITKRILELHDSAIEVRSASGHGTTFTFSLPVYDVTPQNPAPGRSDTPG